MMTDIEILESLKSYTCKPEVIDRAIAALRQEPICETLTSGYVQEIKAECEDAISRAELVRKLNAWDCKVNAIPNYVWKVIRELPSVTPAKKVGHWYKKPHEICYTCDQCRTTNASGVKYNFCPHCGAYMQEGGKG